MPVSFAADIRPLFRDSPDIDSMQGYGLDLSSYEEVKARASEIYACLADGSNAVPKRRHVKKSIRRWPTADSTTICRITQAHH
jgi:hypothetical protein